MSGNKLPIGFIQIKLIMGLNSYDKMQLGQKKLIIRFSSTFLKKTDEGGRFFILIFIFSKTDEASFFSLKTLGCLPIYGNFSKNEDIPLHSYVK